MGRFSKPSPEIIEILRKCGATLGAPAPTENTYMQTVCMQTNTFNMLLVWSKVFVLFVELFPSTGVLWVIGARLHISILAPTALSVSQFDGKIGHT